MAIQQKLRLLGRWLPVGLPYFHHASTTYLHLKDVPYELEAPIGRWLALHPELVECDSKDRVLIEGPNGIAISQDGWSEFVSWIVATLGERLAELENSRTDK